MKRAFSDYSELHSTWLFKSLTDALANGVFSDIWFLVFFDSKSSSLTSTLTNLTSLILSSVLDPMAGKLVYCEEDCWSNEESYSFLPADPYI